MEASKRERVILFGAVPILAAMVGAVATVVVGHLTGGGNQNDVMMEIVRAPGLTFEQKSKLMELANLNTTKFYTWLSSIGTLICLLIGYLGPSLADRIRGR